MLQFSSEKEMVLYFFVCLLPWLFLSHPVIISVDHPTNLLSRGSGCRWTVSPNSKHTSCVSRCCLSFATQSLPLSISPQLSSAPMPAFPAICLDLWLLCMTFSLKRSCSKSSSHSSWAQLLSLGPRPAWGCSRGSAHSGEGLFSLPWLPLLDTSGRWAPTSHTGLPFLGRQAGEAGSCSVVFSLKQGWNPPPGPATSRMPLLFAQWWGWGKAALVSAKQFLTASSNYRTAFNYKRWNPCSLALIG